MNFYDRPPTLLEHRQYGAFRSLREKGAASVFYRRRRWLHFEKYLLMVLAVIQLSGAEIFAQPIKLGYAALTAGQVAPWMAKEAGYFSTYGIEAELIYIPAVAAT